jgi:hypothetical protein
LGSTLQPLIFNPIDIEELGVFFVAQRGVHQDQTIAVLDQQTPHREWDPVPFVGLDPSSPERSRHHAEHGSAIETLQTALQCVTPEVTDME